MRRFAHLALMAAATFALAACEPARAPTAEASAVAEPPSEAAPDPSPTPTADIAMPGQPSRSLDPAEVLRDWARAVMMRDWATARAYWGDHGDRSGLSPRAFAARWSSLLDPRVTVSPGTMEGAAGSSFYTAQVRIVDGARTLRGEIVLRRVNDVPGANDEELRWHVERSTLEP